MQLTLKYMTLKSLEWPLYVKVGQHLTDSPHKFNWAQSASYLRGNRVFSVGSHNAEYRRVQSSVQSRFYATDLLQLIRRHRV